MSVIAKSSKFRTELEHLARHDPEYLVEHVLDLYERVRMEHGAYPRAARQYVLRRLSRLHKEH